MAVAAQKKIMTMCEAGAKTKGVGKKTWLEAIFTNNINYRIIAPNEFFNKIIEPKLVRAKSLYTGTAFVAKGYGKPFGKSIETQCEYEGTEKTVIYNIRNEYIDLREVMLLCDHGFDKEGKPLLELFNAMNEKPILTAENMKEAFIIRLQFNGEIHELDIRTQFLRRIQG